MLNIIARNDMVIVTTVDKTNETSQGLARSMQTDRGMRPCHGLVIAVGPDVKATKVGQVVVFDQYDARRVTINDDLIFAVPEEKIVGELPDA